MQQTSMEIMKPASEEPCTEVAKVQMFHNPHNDFMTMRRVPEGYHIKKYHRCGAFLGEEILKSHYEYGMMLIKGNWTPDDREDETHAIETG